MEPLIHDLYRRGLFPDTEGAAVRHAATAEFKRIGVRLNFYQHTHINSITKKYALFASDAISPCPGLSLQSGVSKASVLPSARSFFKTQT